MASIRCLRALRRLAITPWTEKGAGKVSTRCIATKTHRSFASVAHESLLRESPIESDVSSPEQPHHGNLTTTVMPDANPVLQQPANTVLTTIYSFPTMEPLSFAYYPESHLYLPLRRDLLHRAVVYEGDMTRQGTANTKHRTEIRKSGRKLLPQKGTGRARRGDAKSPILKGGGVAHGPKPRDFSTGLPRKMYDIAWRTALSWRYRRGQLIVVDRIRNLRTAAPYWITRVFQANGWGNEDKRSLLLVNKLHPGVSKLRSGLDRYMQEGRMLSVEEVDVKDLLEMGRVIVEYDALNSILRRHSSDLKAPTPLLNNFGDLPTGTISVA